MSDVPPVLRPASVMEDPSAKSIARVYAVAFLETVPTEELAAVMAEADSFVADVLAPSPQFEALLGSPVTTLEQRLQLIDRVVAPQSTERFANLLRVLAQHGRLDLVRQVIAGLRTEHDHRAGRVRVQVTSAVALSDGLRQEITARLASSLAAEPILETQVDPKVLGGVVIRVGDTVYDGSLRNRLKQLRGKLRERCLNEIQRGRDRFRHSEGN